MQLVFIAFGWMSKLIRMTINSKVTRLFYQSYELIDATELLHTERCAELEILLKTILPISVKSRNLPVICNASATDH